MFYRETTRLKGEYQDLAVSSQNRNMIQRIFMLLVVLFSLCTCHCNKDYLPQDGDIIFHTSRSSQSLAIQKATKSRYSHMGIVYLKEGKPFVFEAIEPVKLTPLKDWVSRGKGGHYEVKRLANSKDVLTSEILTRMLEVGKSFEGRHYDLYFEWSDDRIYCSELVWKIYRRALGLEVGKLQTMAEFDLSDPVVQATIRQRFGDALPKDETVISPAAIFNSNLLVTVHKE